MQYDNTNTGVLFVNEEKSGKRPDYTGKINVDGRELELAGWKRQKKSDGKTFLSLKVQEPYQKKSSEEYQDAAQPSRPHSVNSPPSQSSEIDDESPF